MFALSFILLMTEPLASEPPRVADARARIGAEVRAAVARAGVAYPPHQAFLRVFKEEKQLEIWIGDRGKELVLLESIPICAQSGALGPKRQQGDMQVPEGAYTIDRLKPDSSYHLALHVDYPNRADRAVGSALGIKDLGGDIMVHGNCVTIGCIPLEDGPIERVYLLINDARAKGAEVRIHIFPRKLDDAGLAALTASTTDASVVAFWRGLQPLYLAFERKRRVPKVDIDATGTYVVR
jgi:murein L,D-transpeptidase YafK